MTDQNQHKHGVRAAQTKLIEAAEALTYGGETRLAQKVRSLLDEVTEVEAKL